MNPYKPLRLALGLLFCVGAFGLAQTVPPAPWPDPFEMTFEPVEPATLEPERYTFDNGLIVYLLEDHTLPLIDGAAYLRVPSTFDPEEKIGLAAMTADLLRTGGTEELSPDELDEALEFLAASVEGGANNLYTSVSFSALSDNADEVLGIFADVLLEPRFDPARLEVLRGRTLESIRRQNDEPVNIAQREFFARIAEGHPVGYFPTTETVSNITRDDIQAFYERYFVPNGTIMALSGDFETEEMLATLRELFGDWESRDVELPELPPFNPSPEALVYFVPKETAQSVIFLGHPSVTAYSPTYADLTLANGILGGEGFSSRITTEVRTQRGLAYSAGSGLTQGFGYPGVFYAFSISRGDATSEVIALLLAEIERLQAGGVSETELQQQKETILNRSVFRFTDAAAVAQRTARAEFLGLPDDYYDDYIEQIQEATVEDVQEVAQSELAPDNVIIMVVGDAPLFDRPLDEFGEVVTLDLK